MTSSVAGTIEAETLRFGFGNTALGAILVALSERGVAALFIGDDKAGLERDLREAFPEAALVLDQAGMAETVAKAEAVVDAPHLGSDLPPDPRGSVLEMAVWEALRRVPAGETRTYGAIARSLEIEATAQEVGAACAANRIASLIPCHRVVKSDGKIGGYRWGVRRKYKLINREGVA